MNIAKIDINCQLPNQPNYIHRIHKIVSCSIEKGTPEYNDCLKRAIELASLVYPRAANDSESERNSNRIMQDAFGGVLAEKGWLVFLNSTFGEIASATPFTGASGQIDILLSKNQRIEVRSSFPRHGVKFAICNDRYNFRIIGAYSNLYKLGEVKKDLYTSVLFDTQKSDILSDKVVNFSLIGGATADMMRDLGYTNDLVAEGDLTATKTKYRLIDIKNAWDISHVETWIKFIGY